MKCFSVYSIILVKGVGDGVIKYNILIVRYDDEIDCKSKIKAADKRNII